jgi:DNA topoisomerase IB
LLGFRQGRQWRDVRAQDVNDYLREASGIELTAKDFRTWHGTVAAAVSLAHAGPVHTKTASRRAISQAMRDTAELLGNTAAVARKSYVDPRVIDAYVHGDTIAWPGGQDPAAAFADRALWAKAERATLALLNSNGRRRGKG